MGGGGDWIVVLQIWSISTLKNDTMELFSKYLSKFVIIIPMLSNRAHSTCPRPLWPLLIFLSYLKRKCLITPTFISQFRSNLVTIIPVIGPFVHQDHSWLGVMRWSQGSKVHFYNKSFNCTRLISRIMWFMHMM